MFYLICKISVFSQTDPGAFELGRQLELYRVVLTAMVLAVIILLIICMLQWMYRSGTKKDYTVLSVRPFKRKKNGRAGMGVAPAKLPDPGLIFRFALPGDGGDKVITVGSTEGSIKTWSTEIINNHLELHIIYYVDVKEKKLYELPDPLFSEYAVELKCRGNTLIHYPGLEGYRRMNPSEKIYITGDPAVPGRVSFSHIDAAQPVRFRLGRETGEGDRFISGYFEFHLYLEDYETQRGNGMPGVDKYFLLSLYRIYPGYDISAPDAEGLYPMIGPFMG